MKQSVSAVSLFSGCGGSDLGLKQAGVTTVWSNDIDEAACELFPAVVGHDTIHCEDVSQVARFPKAELLVGCYPCQGYSQAGKRDPQSSINYLYREFDRALRQIKPKAFIVENVDGMSFKQNIELFQAQVTRFRLAGYRVTWQVLNAADYGLPQHRKRLFIVGIESSKKRHFEFPTATHGTKSKPYVTLRKSIWHLRKAKPGSYNSEPFHWYFLSRNRRKEWDDVGPCVVAHWRHIGLHPDSPPLHKVATDHWEFSHEGKARRFSYEECAVMQGFPDPGVFTARTVRERFRAIGNAVPPPLFRAVSASLLEQLA